MKRVIATMGVACLAVVLLTGCTGVTPMNGSLYTELKGPVAMGSGSGMSKTGKAKATAILGVATGDASIEAAMKDGGITKVHHVDTQVKNILGIYAEYTTVVYGE